MANQTDSVTVKLGLDKTELERGVQGALNTLDTFVRRGSQLATMGLTAGFGINELKQFIGSVVDRAKELRNVSNNFGVSIEMLQGWQRMMRKAGWDTEYANDKLGKLMENLGSAQAGDKAKLKYFKDLGIDLESVAGKAMTADQKIRAFVDAISKISNKQIRAALFEEALGRGTSEGAFAVEGGVNALDKFLAHWSNITKTESEDIARGRAFWKGLWQDIYDGAMKATAALLSWDTIVKNTKGLPGPYSGFITSPSAKPSTQETPGTTAATQSQKEEIAKLYAEIKKKEEDLKGTQEKKNSIIKEIYENNRKMSQLADGSFEKDKLSLINKSKELDLERLTTAEKEKQESLDKTIKEKKQAIFDRIIDTETNRDNLVNERNAASDDRYKFTLDEIAGSQFIPGNAWRNAQIVRANQVKMMQEMSRRYAGVGNFGMAGALQKRADDIRGTLDALRSDERYPMKNIDDRITETNKILEELKEQQRQLWNPITP